MVKTSLKIIVSPIKFFTEININSKRINKGKNYDWPIVSDGNKYIESKISRREYSDHLFMNFEPLIISFTLSIGISEIIKIDNDFAKNLQNDYLVE